VKQHIESVQKARAKKIGDDIAEAMEKPSGFFTWGKTKEQKIIETFQNLPPDQQQNVMEKLNKKATPEQHQKVDLWFDTHFKKHLKDHTVKVVTDADGNITGFEVEKKPLTQKEQEQVVKDLKKLFKGKNKAILFCLIFP